MKNIFKNFDLFKGKANGFTLAETLITLGIIGIVAALTIPNLVHKYQAKVFETKFQKSVAMINQIITRTKYNMGIEDIATYCLNGNSQQCYSSINDNVIPLRKTKQHNNSTSKHYNIIRTNSEIYTYNGKNNYDLYYDGYAISYTTELKDGSFLGYQINAGNLTFAVDLNGYGKPNRLGHDIFMFSVSRNKKSQLVTYLNKIPDKNKTDEQATQQWENSDNIFKDYYLAIEGYPCNLDSTRAGNGVGCAYYALKNKCPYDDTKTYWECLPK